MPFYLQMLKNNSITRHLYIYIYIYIYIYMYIIYIHTSKKPTLLYVTTVKIKKSHIFPYRYISELYAFVSVCVCERYMLKI